MQNNLYCSVAEIKLGYIVLINFVEIHVIDTLWPLHEIQGFNSNQQLPSMSSFNESCNKGIRVHHLAKRRGILHVFPYYIQNFKNKIPLHNYKEYDYTCVLLYCPSILLPWFFSNEWNSIAWLPFIAIWQLTYKHDCWLEGFLRNNPWSKEHCQREVAPSEMLNSYINDIKRL